MDVDSKIWAQGFSDGIAAARREIIKSMFQAAVIFIVVGYIIRKWYAINDSK